MKKKSKNRSRLYNPFDGSHKAAIQVHKSKKVYDRKVEKKFLNKLKEEE